MPICRFCKKQLSKETDDWVMPSKNWYYHRTCYEKMKDDKADKSEDIWVDKIYDFLKHDLKVSYNYHMCEKQRMDLLKNGYKNKGIYLSLKYFYEIKHGDWERGGGGIGIVPYIYEDARNYWSERAEVVRQLTTEVTVKEKVIVRKAEKKKEKWSLDDI